jgi:hypothetical protein
MHLVQEQPSFYHISVSILLQFQQLQHLGLLGWLYVDFYRLVVYS